MIRRLGPLSLLFALAAMAGDGISPRSSAEAYPAHVAAAKISIGAAYVTPAQVRKLFGEDLDRHGYTVFEIGMFPAESIQVDISSDDFKLRQGKEAAILRSVSPHAVAAALHPGKYTPPKLPDRVHVYTSETVGYEKGPAGRGGVYTDSRVAVDNYPTEPPATPPPTTDQVTLQERLEEKALPETKSTQAVAGYIFFPKPTGDKRADFELIYFGMDGQISMKLSPTGKP